MIDPQLAAAAVEAEAALGAGRADAHDLTVVALVRAARGDRPAAEALFERALALDPGNPATLTGLAIHHRERGAMREAILACDAAIRAVPDYLDAWLERAAILATTGSPRAARESFTRAAELAPGNPAPHAGLAALAAREGDPVGAQHHAARALTLDPSNPIATNALASAALTGGDAARAKALLEPLIARIAGPTPERSLALGLLGDAHHRLGDHAAAYASFARAKDDFAAIHADEAAGHLTNREFVEAIAAGFAAVPADAWTAPSRTQPGNAAATHVFLLGYPRSGTTLVENILATLPGVAALEERPTLAAADRAFLSGDRAAVIAGLAEFAGLDAAGIEQLRTAYWDKVVAAGVAARAKCFVDMDPLKGSRLPLIARLFPDARVVVMRRDPRDVVWSCFRTQFAMSSGTLDFTSLERAARHYDALMRLTAAALERLPLEFHELHYHRLVQDFDSTTRELCDFIGLEWTPDLRRFDRTADRRGVATASAAQVRRGLYDGTGQWEPYAEFLAPVLPLLAPWIERFGYT